MATAASLPSLPSLRSQPQLRASSGRVPVRASARRGHDAAKEARRNVWLLVPRLKARPEEPPSLLPKPVSKQERAERAERAKRARRAGRGREGGPSPAAGGALGPDSPQHAIPLPPTFRFREDPDAEERLVIEYVDVTPERRHFLTKSSFLTVRSIERAGSAARLALIAIESGGAAKTEEGDEGDEATLNLCAAARQLLGGRSFAVTQVHFEEASFVASQIGARLMLCDDRRCKLVNPQRGGH